MLEPAITAKVSDFFETFILGSLASLKEELAKGNFHKAEAEVADLSQQLHTLLMSQLAASAAASFSNCHEPPENVKMDMRPHKVRIATGEQIEVRTPYYKETPEDFAGSRRPLCEHWGMLDCNSPLLVDRVGFMAMLAPSYDLAHQALNKFGMKICLSSVQKTTTCLADHCEAFGHENIILELGYSVKGKTVVLSVDGGRSRVREYTGALNENGQPCYSTPWREPKLFVIDILGEDGSVDRQELPIYGCRFGEEDMVALLKRYLQKIGIEQAGRVQVIADGAPWIWNRIPSLLAELGVPSDRITESLDCYHAAQYVHDLVKAMPKRIGQKKRKRLLNQFIKLLHEGKVKQVVTKVKSIIKRRSDLVKRWLNYLEKHEHRTQYADYKRLGLMRGSGIIESAIRRIINLRFKNASTFWLPKNVEKLYFLRGALVAGRWDIVINNLSN